MRGKGFWRRTSLVGAGLMGRLLLWAQADGNTGINQANAMVRNYYDSATNLMYAIGGILGIIGAVRVYSMWTNGDPHMGRVAAAWFSACIFLVIVATVIKSFFGL